MSTSELIIRLRVSEVSVGAVAYCPCCRAEVSSGSRFVLACHADEWYTIIRQHTCDCCATEGLLPIMCYSNQAEEVIAQLSQEMAADYKKFYFEKLAIRPV